MLVSELSKIFDNKKKGAFVKIKYMSELPVNAKTKKDGIKVTKETTATIRTRIHYSNMKAVKLSGKELTHQLPYGCFDDSDGLFIKNNDKTYLRVYSSPNKSKSKYFVNGKEVSFKELKESNYLINSWFTKENSKPAAFNIKVENVLEVY